VSGGDDLHGARDVMQIVNSTIKCLKASDGVETLYVCHSRRVSLAGLHECLNLCSSLPVAARARARAVPVHAVMAKAGCREYKGFWMTSRKCYPKYDLMMSCVDRVGCIVGCAVTPIALPPPPQRLHLTSPRLHKTLAMQISTFTIPPAPAAPYIRSSSLSPFSPALSR